MLDNQLFKFKHEVGTTCEDFMNAFTTSTKEKNENQKYSKSNIDNSCDWFIEDTLELMSSARRLLKT